MQCGRLASASVLRMGVIWGKPGSLKGQAELCALTCLATWLLPLCCCPHMEVPDFLFHRASCGSKLCSGWPSATLQGATAMEENPRSEQGTCCGGQTQEASRPAQASENFRNCKRGHELDCPRTSQKEEGVKRKRVLLRAPTFSKLSLREFFLRVRGSTGSGEPLVATRLLLPPQAAGRARGDPSREAERADLQGPGRDASTPPRPHRRIGQSAAPPV